MPARLGEARELRRAFAHLRHRAGRRGQRLGVDGLDRIDHRDVGLLGLERRRGSSRAGSRPAPAPWRASRPSRRARSATCCAALLAAHVEHLASLRASAPSACSSSVDLPMPGSPPISTTPPATRPPPSTRSNSSMPVGWRAARRSPRSRPASRPTRLAQAAQRLEARPWRRLGHRLPPACSRRRSAGTGPATSGSCRRIRCRCRWSSPWPWAELHDQRRFAAALNAVSAA